MVNVKNAKIGKWPWKQKGEDLNSQQDTLVLSGARSAHFEVLLHGSPLEKGQTLREQLELRPKVIGRCLSVQRFTFTEDGPQKSIGFIRGKIGVQNHYLARLRR